MAALLSTAATSTHLLKSISSAQKHQKWPTREDKILYKVEDIECKIKPPTAARSRGQFVFEDFF